MVRIRGALIVFGMAGITIGGSAGELSIDVALIAGNADMRARQWEFREFCMIERGSQPGRGVVAGRAVGRKSRLDVIGIAGPFKILRVATIAIRRRALEFSANVAGGAFKGGMSSGQRKSREFQVIELRAEPGVCCVAAFAGRGKPQCFMVRGDRRLKIFDMAGQTSRR